MSLDTMNQESLTEEEKKRDLYLRQKHTLDLFLERGAISQTQYDKSLGDLTVKIGMQSTRDSPLSRFSAK